MAGAHGARPGQGVRAEGRGRRDQPRRAARIVLRHRRPERRGQDHDAAHGDRAAASRSRPGVGRRHRRVGRPDRGEGAHRRAARRPRAVRTAARPRAPRVPRPVAQHGRPRRSTSRAGELLDLLGLADAADTLVVDYSHGMRKKLVLAAALLHGPRLLFLDEPFEAIDPVSARAIRSVLEHFTGGGGTIVFSSHVMELVERMCDHVAVMVAGRIAWAGPLDALARPADARGRVRRARRRARRTPGAVVARNIRPTEAPAPPQRLAASARARCSSPSARSARRVSSRSWASRHWLPARGDASRPNLAVVVFGLATLGWTFFPILGFGNDETLDPQRLATIPLTPAPARDRGARRVTRRRRTARHTDRVQRRARRASPTTSTSTLLIVAAIVVNLLLCVVASRTLVAVLVPILRSRRGRDFTILAVTILGLLPPVLRAVRDRQTAKAANWSNTISQIADRVRFTPFAWGGTAVGDAAQRPHLAGDRPPARDGGARSRCCSGSGRARSNAGSRAPTHRRRHRGAGGPSPGLIPRALPFLPHNRIGATAAKDLRYFACATRAGAHRSSARS